MNDLEKLFEHAPEGATELGKIDRSGFLAWFNSDGDIWIGYWKERSFPHEVVATRPQPEATQKTPEAFGYNFETEREREKLMFNQAIEETAKSIHNPQQPRKTVEDAVEWNIAKYGSTDWAGVPDNLYFFDGGGDWGFGYDLSVDYLVCTREQFEACVAAKAESEPEWTHVHMGGDECKIIAIEPDINGYVAIMWESGAYGYCKAQSLSPIKPTISKDAKEQLELYVQYRIDKYGDYETKEDLLDYLSHHYITN